MMKWFKIGDEKFIAKDISIQYNIDTANNTFGYAKMVYNPRTEIDITLIVECNNYNNSYFFNLFEKRQIYQNVSDYKFDINSSEFIGNGCIIKTISMDPTTNSIIMDIRSDYSSVKPIEERRDEIIDEILNETSKNKKI